MNHHHHNHSSGHHHHHGNQNLKWAFWLNFSFSIIEFAGGVFTNSMAIMADAVHDLGDTFAIGSAWYFEKLSGKKRDAKFSYGYKRFSTLSALLTSAILLVGSVFIAIEALPRLLNPQPVVSEGMMVLAILGIGFNGLAVFKMSFSSKSLNAKAVRLHLMEDLMGWIAVLVGSVVIYFTNLTVIDPILSLLIALYILVNAIKNLKSVFTIFLQAVPESVDEAQIQAQLKNFTEIKAVHDTHLWTMDGEYNVLTLHLVVDEKLSFNQLNTLKLAVKQQLKKQHIQHVTIEFETQNEDCEQQNC